MNTRPRETKPIVHFESERQAWIMGFMHAVKEQVSHLHVSNETLADIYSGARKRAESIYDSIYSQ